MTEKQYIKNSIDKLHRNLNNLIIYYEYKSNTETHFIQIFQKEIYDSKEFKDLVKELTIDFEKNNYDGFFCIIDSESMVKLNNPTIYLPNVKQEIQPLIIHYNVNNREKINSTLSDIETNYFKAA